VAERLSIVLYVKTADLNNKKSMTTNIYFHKSPDTMNKENKNNDLETYHVTNIHIMSISDKLRHSLKKLVNCDKFIVDLFHILFKVR